MYVMTLIIWASAMPTEAHGLECPYPTQTISRNLLQLISRNFWCSPKIRVLHFGELVCTHDSVYIRKKIMCTYYAKYCIWCCLLFGVT